MMGFGVGGSVAGMWAMGLFGLMVFVGVIGLIVWAIRAWGPANRLGPPNASVDPVTELQLRLARGEITPDEYEELRAHLRD